MYNNLNKSGELYYRKIYLVNVLCNFILHLIIILCIINTSNSSCSITVVNSYCFFILLKINHKSRIQWNNCSNECKEYFSIYVKDLKSFSPELIESKLHWNYYFFIYNNKISYISMPILSSFCSIFFQKNKFSQTHVVFNPVILVISIFDSLVLKKTALKLVRNCFDINP